MATTLRGKRHSEDNTQDKDYYDLPSNVNNKGFVYEEYIFELLKDQNLKSNQREINDKRKKMQKERSRNWFGNNLYFNQFILVLLSQYFFCNKSFFLKQN